MFYIQLDFFFTLFHSLSDFVLYAYMLEFYIAVIYNQAL